MAFRESSLDIVHISSGAGPWSGFCVAAEAESCTAAGSRRSAGSLWSRNYNYRHGERHPRAGTYPEIRASGGAVGGAAQRVEMQAGGLLRLVLDGAVMGDSSQPNGVSAAPPPARPPIWVATTARPQPRFHPTANPQGIGKASCRRKGGQYG